MSLASLMAAEPSNAQDAGGVQLPTIDVTGDQGGSYQATQQSITRLPAPLLDTPQTVNVVPQQVIQEQRAFTMEDALRNVTGITFSAGEGGQQGDSPFIRGFVARTDIFRDGIRDPGWYTRDLFSIDRVEVYKGPSAFAFGRGSTGGAINNVTKLPIPGQQYVEGTATGTTGPGYRADLDANGTRNGITGRVSALYQDVDTPDRDTVFTKRWGIAPSASVNITDKTKATFSYIYQGEESIPDYGHPWLPPPTYSSTTGAMTNPGYYGNGSPVTPVPISRNTFLGFPSGAAADVVETDTHIVTGKLEHEFSEQFKVTNVTRYMAVNRFARPTAPRNLLDGGGGTLTSSDSLDAATVGLQHWQNLTDNTQLINQTDAISKFETLGLKHTLATGVELSHETRHQVRANICFPTGPSTPVCRTDLTDPNVPVNTPAAPVYGPPQDTDMTNVGAYASDQVKLNKYVELLGSIRYDRFQATYDDLTQAVPANQHLSRTDNMFSWRYGIVVHPTENSSVYYASGVSYNPSAELGTLSTGAVSTAPERTISYEIGAKADVLDGGRLSVTGAIFRIDKTNMRVTDPANTTVQVLDGQARSEGFELGIAGKITNQWSVFAGFTRLYTELLDTPDLSQLGRELPNAPPKSFSLWSTYDVTPKFTVGGGVTYNSDTFANAQNTQYVPEYWKFDAMATYKIDAKSLLQLNIYNITDEFYYAQYYSGQAVPASGRWASLSYRIRY